MNIIAYQPDELTFTMHDPDGDVIFYFTRLTDAEAEALALVKITAGGIEDKHTDKVTIFLQKVHRIEGLTLQVGDKKIPITSGAEFCKHRDQMPVVRNLVAAVSAYILKRSMLSDDERKN